MTDMNKYIEMCKKAQKELNPYWKWKKGYSYYVNGEVLDYTQMDVQKTLVSIFYIPSIEQLLLATFDKPINCFATLSDQGEGWSRIGIVEDERDYYIIFLKAFMNLKHNKNWDGLDWISYNDFNTKRNMGMLR